MPALASANDLISQYRDGADVIYALLQRAARQGSVMFARDIIEDLDSAARKGGHAKFIRPSYIRALLSKYNGELWARYNPETGDLDPSGKGAYWPAPLRVARENMRRLKEEQRHYCQACGRHK